LAATFHFSPPSAKIREEAFELMIKHAEKLVPTRYQRRYDANEVMSGVTEVLCYGTAVKVE